MVSGVRFGCYLIKKAELAFFCWQGVCDVALETKLTRKKIFWVHFKSLDSQFIPPINQLQKFLILLLLPPLHSIQSSINQFQIYGIYAMNQWKWIKIFPCFENLLILTLRFRATMMRLWKRLLKNLLIPTPRFSVWRGCQLQKESISIFIMRKTNKISGFMFVFCFVCQLNFFD